MTDHHVDQGGGAAIVELLVDMERRAWRAAEMLPVLHEHASNWDGLIYRLGGYSIATPLDEVAEILDHMPVLTPVPGVSFWVAGIANVRGNILPVIDLEGFFLDAPIERSRRTRVLIVQDDGGQIGLMVNDVGGMRHFPLETRADADPVPAPLTAYVDSMFKGEQENYLILSLRALASSAEFQMAAV